MLVEPLQSAPAPHEAALRLHAHGGLCWLDGLRAHRDGRYSFLAVAPVERIARTVADAEPLSALDALEAETLGARGADPSAELPAASIPRWAGFVAYDAAWAGRRGTLAREPTAPALAFARYDAWLAFDHVEERAFIAADDAAACARLRERLAAQPRAVHASAGPLDATDPSDHLRAIDLALEHIAAGDLYQVNLARFFHARLSGSPLALFLALRDASPVPLGMFFDTPGLALAARSMERFLRWHRDERALHTRPIKGTLARDGARDADEHAALQADPKERAEHAMIVDLMRNDLGRVAEVGSVEVPEVMAAEPYRGLHHLVSTVRCRTRPEVGLRALLEATFPPGSVTGTPKLAAIEHIERAEPQARGAYTGAYGFVDQRGGLSLAVAIRTAVVQAGQLVYGAGGGIVEASDPARELAETELKADALRRALSALGEAPDLR